MPLNPWPHQIGITGQIRSEYAGQITPEYAAGERSIDLTSPARTAKGGSSGRLTLEDFSLDDVGLVLKCPDGVAPVSTSAARAKLQARFDLAICKGCLNKDRCPVQADKHDGQFARFQYTPTRAQNQKRRLYEGSDAFREIYRWRAGMTRPCHA
jgi:hypothetical protein